jgi:hypothetical protein
MDDVTVVPAAQVPVEILKDKRAISLYWLAVGSLAVVPVLAVAGLLLLAALGRVEAGQVITLIATAASTALGGLVGMVARDNGAGKSV